MAIQWVSQNYGLIFPACGPKYTWLRQNIGEIL